MNSILFFFWGSVFIYTIQKSKQMPIVKLEDSQRQYIYFTNHSKTAETKT